MQVNLPQEKRKPGLLRPSLTKAKNFSTGTLPQMPAPESQLPPFRFGNGQYNSKPTTSSSLSLLEIFADSPVQEKPAQRLAAPAFVPPRSRPALAVCGSSSRGGSPVSNHMRKSSNPLVRPRKQFRRSLSMFEHPEDVMKQEKERSSPSVPLLPSIMDVETAQIPQLPHFQPEGETGSLPRITKETMVSVLDGHYDHLYEKRVVIDCRFEYEYEGGHIEGAVNFNDKEALAAQLFDVEPTRKALLIFHCEYSAHRAPLMAKFIRNKDRAVNAESYPALTYPEAYILDGGYSTFFKDYRLRCYPQNYVEMHAKEHVVDCERGLGKVKQRTKLVRAQTFAFGQHSPQLDSSPTAMGRSHMDSDMDLDMGLDYTPMAGARSGFDALRRNNRMLSY
jgi:M-phase inducer tyrosine phosphatase